MFFFSAVRSCPRPLCAALVVGAGALACDPAAPVPPAGFTAPVIVLPVPRPGHKLSPGLQWFVEHGGPTERRAVLVDLAVQLDLGRVADSLAGRGVDRQGRRTAVVAALRAVAHESQRRLGPALGKLQERGAISDYEAFVIVNRIFVRATPAGVRALAARRDVASLAEETDLGPALSLASRGAQQQGAPRTSWALRSVGAETAWRRGLDGRGVVVGIIDAGASAAHEQLQRGFRGGTSSWYDPAGGAPAPADGPRGHGTGVLSAAVGWGPAGRGVGVAPGATWVACVGLPEGRYHNVATTRCADWILTTAQPAIVINAWQLPAPGCDRSLERLVSAWRAAEILPVFAAGNHGPASGTDRSPGNYVRLEPGGGTALSVGGMAVDGAAFARGSRGPNSCNGSVYPMLVAPAESVWVAYPLTPRAYIRTEGTSVAAGLAAGAAAILLQRDPEAGVADLEWALRASAVDLGSPGPDNTFGYGRLSLATALDSLDRRRNDATKSRSDAPTHR